MKLFRPVAEFPAIAPVIYIAVFAPLTKNISAYDTDIDDADATTDPEFSEVLSPAVPLATSQLCLQAAVSTRPSFFTWESDHNHVWFCGACVFVSSLHPYP